MAKTIRKRKARIVRSPVSKKAKAEFEADKPKHLVKVEINGETVIVAVR